MKTLTANKWRLLISHLYDCMSCHHPGRPVVSLFPQFPSPFVSCVSVWSAGKEAWPSPPPSPPPSPGLEQLAPIFYQDCAVYQPWSSCHTSPDRFVATVAFRLLSCWLAVDSVPAHLVPSCPSFGSPTRLPACSLSDIMPTLHAPSKTSSGNPSQVWGWATLPCPPVFVILILLINPFLLQAFTVISVCYFWVHILFTWTYQCILYFINGNVCLLYSPIHPQWYTCL